MLAVAVQRVRVRVVVGEARSGLVFHAAQVALVRLVRRVVRVVDGGRRRRVVRCCGRCGFLLLRRVAGVVLLLFLLLARVVLVVEVRFDVVVFERLVELVRLIHLGHPVLLGDHAVEELVVHRVRAVLDGQCSFVRRLVAVRQFETISLRQLLPLLEVQAVVAV